MITHGSGKRHVIENLLDKLIQMNRGTNIKKTTVRVVKEQILLRATKDRKLWGTMTIHIYLVLKNKNGEC